MRRALVGRCMAGRRHWDELRSRLAREHSLLALLAIAYFVTGRAGLSLSYGHPAVSLVWPPAGLALGAFILLGYRVWPIVLGASVALYATTLGPVPATLMMAAGNTCEGVLAAYLVNRYAGGRHALQNPRNSLRFTGVVLLTTATVSATMAPLALIASGLAYWTDYGR